MNAEPRIDARFESWLLHETGISAPTLGAQAFERAVWERVRATQAASASGDLETYWQLLNASRDERQALVELIVVPETWFFRDREAFVALARLANERLVRNPSHVLRLLSVPCSTGEEPYSIAMALFDAGIGPERFSIDAVDISERALDIARRGVYGRNSFRGRALEFRERHFAIAGPATASGDVRYELSARVHDAVRFIHANLFDAPYPADARYDFILCRNVLIYFDRDSQDRAIRLLDARLAQDGMLLVGPAETGLMMRHAFNPARIPLAFAFTRTPADDARPPRQTPLAPAPAVAPVKPVPPVRPIPPIPPIRPVRQPFAPQVAAARASRGTHADTARNASAATEGRAKREALLAEASRLADEGLLDQAERVANQCVNIHGPDASVFYLLGLIMDARGRSADAGDYYRKTLYLEPGHYEALTHLAALLEMTGDTAGAGRLTRRAERAAQARRESPEPHATYMNRTSRTRGFHD
ncbi:CheR family methyltransferase [Paraburkholderia sp. SARCC-3016]|uniref:CheR family methyltransferase n=1 Tax=Paraburkholderia sp. SARCC-3016 TaxID=3058611 RepID=UPI0028095D97|nr:CheR family methyltransferase [Paraburkholderia sp. SARCC-3016]MDQ7977971.1 CheR family methyltransferase [Paraburkholderia sp. SARCC-3016]